MNAVAPSPLPTLDDQEWFELTFKAPFKCFLPSPTPGSPVVAFEMPEFKKHLVCQHGYAPEAGSMADFIAARFGDAELARLLQLVSGPFQASS